MRSLWGGRGGMKRFHERIDIDLRFAPLFQVFVSRLKRFGQILQRYPLAMPIIKKRTHADVSPGTGLARQHHLSFPQTYLAGGGVSTTGAASRLLDASRAS